MLPRVTGMKMENAWGRVSRGMIRCTARLSRPLRAREQQLLETLPATTIPGRSEVVHECRPDEVEDWQSLLSDVLRGEWSVPAARSAAQTAGAKARRERRRPRPDPAA